MTGLLVGAAAVMVAGVLWSELRHPRLEWLFKPLASLCFVLLALAVGALDSGYGRWLLAGLILCMAGDVLLISNSEKSFLAGLGSFLAGHLLYAAAFLQLPQNRSALLLALSSLRWRIRRG